MIKHSSGSGGEGAMPPLGPVKIGHKKDGPLYPAAGSATEARTISLIGLNVQLIQ